MKYQTIEQCKQRIAQLQANPKFAQIAKDFIQNRKTFNDELDFCKDILTIGYGRFPFDGEKIKGNFFHDKELVELMIGFYRHLDSLAGDDNSLQLTAVDNMQYLNFVHDPDYRSNCGMRNFVRHINVGIGGSVRDPANVAHEVGHSQSKNFITGKPFKDENMREFCTVIIDRIFPEYLKEQRPDLAENVLHNLADTQFVNRAKAQLSLFEGAFVRAVAGEITADDAMDEYSKIYGKNIERANELLELVDKVTDPTVTKKPEFRPLYETRYLFPQMLGIYAREEYLKNPVEFAKKFKKVLQRDCEITEAEALDMLGFPEREKIVQWYKDNIAKILEREYGVTGKENEDEIGKEA